QVMDGSKDCEVGVRLDDVATPEYAEVTATYQGLVAGEDLTGRCTLTPCAQRFALGDKQTVAHALRVGTGTLATGAGAGVTGDSAGRGDAPDGRTVVVDHCGAPRTLVVQVAAPKPVPPPEPVPTPTVPAPEPTPAPPITTPPRDPHPPVTDMRRLSNIGLGV